MFSSLDIKYFAALYVLLFFLFSAFISVMFILHTPAVFLILNKIFIPPENGTYERKEKRVRQVFQDIPPLFQADGRKFPEA